MKTAPEILQDAIKVMEERGKHRDTPEGERSMKRCVDAFNNLTGNRLSERDGWLFMAVLKIARATNTATGKEDDFCDLAAYAALAGEAALKANPLPAKESLTTPPEDDRRVPKFDDVDWAKVNSEIDAALERYAPRVPSASFPPFSSSFNFNRVDEE